MGRVSPLARRLARAHRLGMRDWRDLARGLWELGRANRRLKGMSAADIYRNRASEMPEWPAGEAPPEELLSRVALAISRAAAVAPFRSDCLIQAEAARHWLAGCGIATEIRLGARRESAGSLDAHAWLVCGERIVTGGDVSGFVPFE